jgi:hypothetical protein
MINELEDILSSIPKLLLNNKLDTLLINKYPPIIHRISIKISDNRTLFLHKLFNTEEKKALMHSHSWNFACKVLQGKYEMGIGFSSDRNKPPASIYTSFVKAGDIYEMTSPNIWHYTKPTSDTAYSYSVMLIGERYRERRAENNEKLSIKDKQELVSWFLNFYNINSAIVAKNI